MAHYELKNGKKVLKHRTERPGVKKPVSAGEVQPVTADQPPAVSPANATGNGVAAPVATTPVVSSRTGGQ